MVISNFEFYANNVSNARVPTAEVAPTTPGNFDGSIYSSLSTPILSRVGHDQHVYPQSGNQLTLVFRSNIKATLCGIYGFEDMVETRDPDGRTITITWTVPVGEPAVSRHFGVRAKTAGGEHEIFTIAHINKTSSDVFFGGVGTSTPTLKASAEKPELTSGCTLVIKDGTYSNIDDFIQLGSLGLALPSGYYVGNLTFPNGVYTEHTVGTEQGINVSMFSCIISETPLGAIVDRQHKGPFALHMQGNDSVSPGLSNLNVSGGTGNQNDGGRTVRGVLFMGFAIRGASAACARVKKSGFIDCSIVDDHSLEAPQAGSVAWTGDGAVVTYTGTEDCIMEGNHVFGNLRYAVSFYVVHKSAQRKTMLTSGAMQGANGEIYNAVAYYNNLNHKNYNCWDLDSADYILGGVRYPQFPDLTNKIDVQKRWLPGETYDGNVIVTYGMNTAVRGLNDNIDMYGQAHLNDGRPGLAHVNRSGQNTGENDILENSYGWYTRRTEFDINPHENYPNGNDGPPALYGGKVTYDGVTCGRADWVPVTSASMIAPWYSAGHAANIKNVAIVSATWDTAANFTDTVFYGDGANTTYVTDIGGLIVVDPPANMNATWPAAATDYDLIAKENCQTQGIKYTCRVEPKSPLEGDPRPCQDIFRTKGRYLTFWNFGPTLTKQTDFETVYEDVNWYNRLSVSRIRREHQLYQCTSNGLSLDGNKGHADGGTSRADYYQLTFGMTTDSPDNCPYIINIWGYVTGDTAVLTWDGVPAEYRGQATGYDFYINDALAAENQDLDSTEIRFSGLTAGSKEIYMIVKDPVRGNSGPSKPITLVI